MNSLLCLTLAVLLLAVVNGQASSNKPTTVLQSTTAPSNSSSTCAKYTNCDDCVQKSKGKCVFCNDGKTCKELGILHLTDVCTGGLMNTSWATCTVNMMALIIGMSVVGGVLLLSVCCCICCCCCCKDSAKQKLKWMREDALNRGKSDERKARYAERRAEREAKNDEIRKKYGLFKDGSGKYQKFDNDDDEA